MLTRKLINPITNSHNIKTLSPSKNHIMNKKIRIKEIEINTMRAKKKKTKKKKKSNENGKKKKNSYIRVIYARIKLRIDLCPQTNQ